MRLPLTLSLVLLGLASARGEAPEVKGTLPEDLLPGLGPLLKTAVEQSPNTISASIAVAQQEANKMAAYSILYPSVNLNTSYQVNTESATNSTNSTSKGIFYSVGINQPVFQWGAYKNGAEIGKIGLKISERQYADAYRSLAITLREQYMLLIAKKITVRNERFKLKIANEKLDAQKARFEAGSSSQAELQGFQVAVETQQLADDRAEEDYAYAKRTFMQLVGIKELDDDSIPLELPHPEYSASLADAVLAGFVGSGVESTFQSQVYKMVIQQQDLSYSIAKVRMLPKFNASASASYSNYTAAAQASVTQLGIQSENYQIGAYWDIFDGFATRSAKLSALANKRLYERQLKTYVDTSIDTMTYMRHQIGFSSRAMAFAELHTRLITDQVNRLGEDLKLGYSSQATIDEGLLNQYATEFDQSNARSDFLSHWTEFISLAGLDPALDNISPRYVR